MAQRHMVVKMKIELKDIVMIVSLIGTAFAGLLYLNAEHASAANFKSFKEYTAKEFIDIRIERIIMQLNNISAKEKLKLASQYDIIRKDELKREWDMLKEQKKNAN